MILQTIKNFRVLKLILPIVVMVLSFSQTNFANDESIKKANEILRIAQQQLEKKIKISEIKTLDANFKFVYSNVKTITKPGQIEYRLSKPDKVRIRRLEFYSSNDVDSTYIINKQNFSQDIQILVNGAVVMNDDPDPLSSLETSEEKRLNRLKETFYLFFPMFLDTKMFSDFSLEFKFIGMAESPEGKANVLEAISEKGTKYRLFFDEKSGLLLMMTLDWKSTRTDKFIQRKYFYSDYKENGGLLVTHKVIVEQDNQRIQEFDLKNLKVNPTFENDVFLIKDN